MERSYSKIYESLDAVSKKRYREKLDRIQEVAGDNIQDPYLSDKENVSHQDCPLVEFGDIYSYLINAPSPYTKNELKAFKSLEGYRCLVAGFVGSVIVFAAGSSSSIVFVRAKVRHSQAASLSPLELWAAVESNGIVSCAHCTCTAGLGEACSHVAAVLFCLDAHTKFIQSTACTSKPCQWLAPSMKDVKQCRVADIRFTDPEKMLTGSDTSKVKQVKVGSQCC